MANLDTLKKFLHEANRSTYASGDETLFKKESDKSTTIIFQKGDFALHDNYFGGEPYGGREVVFHKNKPIFMMVYYGWIEPSVEDINKVYAFLQESLRQAPVESPRGPDSHSNGEFSYEFQLKGSFENFTAEEVIYENKTEIYRAKFIGGLVDQREE